jgi:hypothetical protein
MMIRTLLISTGALGILGSFALWWVAEADTSWIEVASSINLGDVNAGKTYDVPVAITNHSNNRLRVLAAC